MARRGKPSEAHEYDERGVCIYCDMYRVNVEKMAHVCKSSRELELDKKAADALGVSLEDYRNGGYVEGGQWRTI